MANDREELAKLAYELQAYREEGQILQQQIANLQATLAEIDSSAETLKNLKSVKEEVLLPIGAGVYLKAKIIDNDKILLSIGADVIAEKNVNEAVEFLASKSKKINELRNQLQKNLVEVSNNIMKLDEDAKKITGRMRAGKDVQQEEKEVHQEYR